MPSHPERVRQNNCEHKWPYLMPAFRDMKLSDGRRCLKCNLSFDEYVNRYQNRLGPIKEVEGY